LLVGVCRIRLIEELPPAKLFREARVELLPEDNTSRYDATKQAEQQAKLVASFQKILPTLTDSVEPLQQLLSQQISLGMLTDIMGYTLDLGIELKLQLLGEPLVETRAELLSAAAQRLTPKVKNDGRQSFPPKFSLN
jgi:Lon protease-like protein